MAKLDHSNTTTYRIINVCVILTLAYSIFSIAVFLRIKTAICPTTALGINASIALVSPLRTFMYHRPGWTDISTVAAYHCRSRSPMLPDQTPEKQASSVHITFYSLTLARVGMYC